MPNRPEYPTAPLLERAASGLLATVTGVGLLVAVVAVFQTPLPEPLAGSWLVLRPVCAQASTASAACPSVVQPTVIAAR
jgi:hypothetical protein